MRSIWLNLVAAQGTSLEEPLVDTYTTEQLQLHVCKQVSATLQWRSDNPKPAQVKKVRIPPNNHMILIRGGRWLLIGFDTGAVIAYDLDSAGSRKMTIIEPGPVQEPISTWMVDMDDSAPCLTFKLAIISARPDGSAPKLRTYQVSLVGHGDQAELAATFIISIADERPQPGVDWYLRFASLRGEYFCRGSTIFDPGYHERIEAFKWRDCIKSGPYPVSTIIPRSPDRMVSAVIPPGNQILVLLTKGYLAIYDLPDPQVEAPIFLSSEPRWKLSTGKDRWGHSPRDVQISAPHLGHLSSYTACTTIDGIYKVIVPLDSSESPQITKLRDFPVAKFNVYSPGHIIYLREVADPLDPTQNPELAKLLDFTVAHENSLLENDSFGKPCPTVDFGCETAGI